MSPKFHNNLIVALEKTTSNSNPDVAPNYGKFKVYYRKQKRTSSKRREKRRGTGFFLVCHQNPQKKFHSIRIIYSKGPRQKAQPSSDTKHRWGQNQGREPDQKQKGSWTRGSANAWERGVPHSLIGQQDQFDNKWSQWIHGDQSRSVNLCIQVPAQKTKKFKVD